MQSLQRGHLQIHPHPDVRPGLIPYVRIETMEEETLMDVERIRMILGSNVKGRYIHVICGIQDDLVYIISAYYPDPDRWESDCMTRKG